MAAILETSAHNAPVGQTSRDFGDPGAHIERSEFKGGALLTAFAPAAAPAVGPTPTA